MTGWLRRGWRALRCILRGHADLLEYTDDGLMVLSCADCGRISPGWQVNGKLRRRGRTRA